MKYILLSLTLILPLSAFALDDIQANVEVVAPEASDGSSVAVTSAPADDSASAVTEVSSTPVSNGPQDSGRGKFSELRAERKVAKEEFKSDRKAARALSGDERKAAMEAARAKWKDALAKIREERKAMIEAMRADRALSVNDAKNEEDSSAALAAGEPAPSEDAVVAEEAVAPAQTAEEERAPASVEGTDSGSSQVSPE
jgi:hypothetical protein